MIPSSQTSHPQPAASIRSSEDYLAHIPKRIAQLISGRETEVESALREGDPSALEWIADSANVLEIEGQRIEPAEVSIASAPTIAEILGSSCTPPAATDHRPAIADLLHGRMVPQLFFAGAATRFSRLAEGPLYFFDIWGAAERVLASDSGKPPSFAGSMTREEFGHILNATRAAAAGPAPSSRMRIPLGARILLSYRLSIERLARAAGESPDRARKLIRLVVHVPESPEGQKILADLVARRFCGFDPENVIAIPQPCFGGWGVSAGKVVPLPQSREFPYGHGYSTMQLIHGGAGKRWVGGAWNRLATDVLAHLGERGRFFISTHRVNDLTQLFPGPIDLGRTAAGRRLVDSGHAVVIELVANPHRQKGGNWVERKATGHRFLVEGMNAKAGAWPAFMETHRGAPYNAFRSLYDGEGLRRILLRHSLADHLRVREAGPRGAAGSQNEGPAVGLYLESVTGDLTQIEEARPAAFRFSATEEIHDMKELKDLAEGIRAASRQDSDEEFRAMALESSI